MTNPVEPKDPTEEEEVYPRPSRSTLRKTFIASVIAGGFFTYIYLGNLQLLLKSRYFSEVGIPSLSVSVEARYYIHMAIINGVLLGVIIFLWLWRRMTGKRLIIMLLFFNLAALAAGYSSLRGSAYFITNFKMREAVMELARVGREYPTANLSRYPRYPEEIKSIYGRPFAPYSYHGQKSRMKISVVNRATGPMTELRDETDAAGTIYYSVDKEGNHFWITYLEYNFATKESVLALDPSTNETMVFTEIKREPPPPPVVEQPSEPAPKKEKRSFFKWKR